MPPCRWALAPERHTLADRVAQPCCSLPALPSPYVPPYSAGQGRCLRWRLPMPNPTHQPAHHCGVGVRASAAPGVWLPAGAAKVQGGHGGGPWADGGPQDNSTCRMYQEKDSVGAHADGSLAACMFHVLVTGTQPGAGVLRPQPSVSKAHRHWQGAGACTIVVLVRFGDGGGAVWRWRWRGRGSGGACVRRGGRRGKARWRR